MSVLAPTENGCSNGHSEQPLHEEVLLEMADQVGAVRKAAKAEKQAETSLAEKKVAWRTAWWRTTLALGVPSERGTASAALDAAAEELGLSKSYMSHRRTLGQAMHAAKNDLGLEDKIIFSLPPRLTLAWVRELKQPIDARALKLIQKDDEEKLSLRAFIDGYGGQPMDTCKMPKPFVNPAPEDVVRNLTPTQKQAIVRDVVSKDPEVARQMVNEPETRRAIVRATVEREQEAAAIRRARNDRTPSGRAVNEINDSTQWDNTLIHGYNAVADLKRFLKELPGFVPLTESRAERVEYIAEQVRVCLGYLEALSTAQDIDTEFAELLKEGTD